MKLIPFIPVGPVCSAWEAAFLVGEYNLWWHFRQLQQAQEQGKEYKEV